MWYNILIAIVLEKKMNQGFEITQDDIENVLVSHGKNFTQEEIESIAEGIDDDIVASAVFAVEYDEEMSDEEILDKQTEAAYDEIASQLYENGVLTKEDVLKYGNPNIIKE
jgi:ribosomal protein L16 Arg81 hydroxylase